MYGTLMIKVYLYAPKTKLWKFLLDFVTKNELGNSVSCFLDNYFKEMSLYDLDKLTEQEEDETFWKWIVNRFKNNEISLFYCNERIKEADVQTSRSYFLKSENHAFYFPISALSSCFLNKNLLVGINHKDN